MVYDRWHKLVAFKKINNYFKKNLVVSKLTNSKSTIMQLSVELRLVKVLWSFDFASGSQNVQTGMPRCIFESCHRLNKFFIMNLFKS